MTNPQQPFPPGEPGQPNYVPPAATRPYGQPDANPAPVPGLPAKRGNALTSKPVIGIAALVVGLMLGASVGGAGKPATVGAAAPVPIVTVTATYEATEPTEEPASQPTDEPTEPAAPPSDTSNKWGQKVGFTYEDVEISVRIDAPKASSNTFDKDNLEAKVTVCNRGTDTIDEMSAQGLGLYAEDKSDGQYDLYGAYRTPEFPVYSYDSAKLKPGKCRTGWVAFEDGRKAVRIATEVNDETYTWSKSGS